MDYFTYRFLCFWVICEGSFLVPWIVYVLVGAVALGGMGRWLWKDKKFWELED